MPDATRPISRCKILSPNRHPVENWPRLNAHATRFETHAQRGSRFCFAPCEGKATFTHVETCRLRPSRTLLRCGRVPQVGRREPDRPIPKEIAERNENGRRVDRQRASRLVLVSSFSRVIVTVSLRRQLYDASTRGSGYDLQMRHILKLK